MAQKAAYLAALGGGGGGGGGARALLDGESVRRAMTMTSSSLSGPRDDEEEENATTMRRCESYLNAVMRMRVVETKRCLKETGCGKVPSHLKAKELQRLVFLCAVYPTEDEGMQREVGLAEEGVSFAFEPLKVRQWIADFQREGRQSRTTPQRPPQSSRGGLTTNLPPLSSSKLSRGEKILHDTLERALNADPYFALVLPTNFHPTRPNGVVKKPTKMAFTKANNRMTVNFELTTNQEQFLRANSKTAQLRAYSVVIKEDEANAKNRVLWPNECVMHVNGANVDVTRRSSSQKVTKSTRERPAVISNARGVNLRAGQNTLRIMGVDARHFALCVLLVRERPEKEVRALIPPPKEFEYCVNNIKKSLGFTIPDDDDEDIIGPDTAIISVRCPIRMCMMETPARLENCNQACAFDADSFLELHKATRKWTCPCCGKAGGPKDVRIDGFLVRVMAKLKSDLRHKRINSSSASVSRIEIDKECRWRYRESAGDKQELGEWVDLAETRAVELSIQGRSIDDEVEVATLEDDGKKNNNKRSAVEVTATDEIVIDEEERKRPKRDDNNKNDNKDEDDYDSEEELRNACREAATLRGNGGENDSVPDIIVIDDSDSEDEVRIVASTSGDAGGAPPAQPLRAQGTRETDMLQCLMDTMLYVPRERDAQNGTQPWQREILDGRAAAEARQREERLASERRVKEQEEQLRVGRRREQQQRISAMHNGRNEYERSVMASAQAQPFGLQPQYYHNVNMQQPPQPHPSHPSQFPAPSRQQVARAPLLSRSYRPPPPLPPRQTQHHQQRHHHQQQSVRFVCRRPNQATTNTTNTTTTTNNNNNNKNNENAT